jgi:carboxylesterase type B
MLVGFLFQPLFVTLHLTAELPLLFGTHPNFRGNSTAFEYVVSEAMQSAWYAFVSDPKNGLASVDWPAYSSDHPNVRQFGANGIAAATIEHTPGDAACG